MKKVFISVAFAAALFFGASAQTVPTWYSYQGVSDVINGENVKVVFYVENSADHSVVYAEEHTVTTNASGAFNCQLGLGTPVPVDNYETVDSFTEIDWTAAAYEVRTFINDDNKGTAKLGAVPYATVAGKALGIEGVEGNLNETLEELWLAIEEKDQNLTMAINAQAAVDEEQNQYIEGLMEQVETVATLATGASNIAIANEEAIDALKDQAVYAVEQADNANLAVTSLNNQVLDLAAEVETNINGLAEAENTLIELTEQVRSNTAAIAVLGGGETGDINQVTEAIEDLQQRMDNQELGFTQLNNVVTDLAADVQTNIEGLAEAEQTLTELTPTVKGNTAAIAKLQEDVAINIEGIANAEQTLTELTPAVKGNTAAIAKLQEDVAINIEGIANAEQTLTEITPAVKGNTAAIAKLQEDVEINSNGLAEAEKAISEISEEFPGMKGAIEALKAEVEINSNGLAEAENTLIELTEQMPGINGKINALTEQMEGLYEAFETQAMAAITSLAKRADDTDAEIEKLSAEVEINSNGLAEAEKAISEISEELPGMKGAIEAMKADVETNANGLAEAEKAISELSEEFPGLKGAIEALKADVAINIEGIANAEQSLVELTEQVRSNTAAIARQNVESIWEKIAKIESLMDAQGMAIADLQNKVNGLHNN